MNEPHVEIALTKHVWKYLCTYVPYGSTILCSIVGQTDKTIHEKVHCIIHVLAHSIGSEKSLKKYLAAHSEKVSFVMYYCI